MMNKKSEVGLIKGLIMGLFLISVFSLVFVLAGEEVCINKIIQECVNITQGTCENVCINKIIANCTNETITTCINETSCTNENQEICTNVTQEVCENICTNETIQECTNVTQEVCEPVYTEENISQEAESETLALAIENSATPALTSVGEDSLINYKFSWGQTNITLYKDNKIFNDVFIENKENGKGWKFGANDASLTESETARYKFVLNSTNELILLYKEGFDEKGNFTYKYPILYNYHENPDDYWNEYRHIYNFKDICSKKYSKCEWLWHHNSIEIFFTSNKNIDPSIENVSSCKTLDIENQYYQQNQDIPQDTEVNCIVINNNSITFDGNGHSITSNYDVSGIVSSSDYVDLTIKNTNISMGAGSGGRGIELLGSSGNEIINSIIYNNILSNQHTGLYLYYVINSTIKGNKIENEGDTTYGIYLSYSDNNILTNNIGKSSSQSLYLSYSDNNVLINNTWESSSSHGIDLSYSTSNIFKQTNSTATLFPYTAIHFVSYSSNNNFTDCIQISGAGFDISYSSDGSANNTFLNCSYDDESLSVYGNSLIRKWYYRAYVNDTAGNPVSSASVKLYNISDDLQTELITGDSYLALDGNGDYVDTGSDSSLQIIGNLTLVAWFNSKDSSGGRRILSNRDYGNTEGFPLSLSAGKPYCDIAIEGQWKQVYNDSVISLNKWYHIVCTYDNSNIRLYLDGNEVNSTSASGTITLDANNELRIGMESGSTYYPFNGSIDNVMVFNRSLDSTEIADLYDLGRKDTSYTNSNLVSAWRFNDPTQYPIAVDSAGDNDGTFEGDADYGGESGFTEIYDIIDYINNGGTRTYYSDYTIYADKTCYPSYRAYYNVTEEENSENSLKHVLTLGSSTYQNWNWNFADNCNLANMAFNIGNYNITSSGSGIWTLDNIDITCSDFDMSSSGSWTIIGSPQIRIIGP